MGIFGYIWIYKDIYEKLTEEEILKVVSDANSNMSKVSWKNGLVGYQFKKGNLPINNKKEVHQYTIDGEYINTWKSCKKAALSLGSNRGYTISTCAIGKSKTAYGFRWSYELIK